MKALIAHAPDWSSLLSLSNKCPQVTPAKLTAVMPCSYKRSTRYGGRNFKCVPAIVFSAPLLVVKGGSQKKRLIN